ncbi:MAG: peptide chain release factor N(5)-glutamine methyltransferase [Clostridia bacterium]|nr:peptide chain release factor N(5)-glutamine methyltransferase [Clostridia bacterium]
MNYKDLYHEGIDILMSVGVAEAQLDARLLLEHICHTDRSYLLAHGEERVSDDLTDQYRSMIRERARRVPLQYITGTQEFMGKEFIVNEKVLIPRQDTECLVEEVLRYVEDGARVLDLCTGSGCIIISIMLYKNAITGVACDLSDQALDVARKNARDHGVIDQLDLVHCDLFDGIQGTFDVIVSNPPYIPTSIIDSLEPEVKDCEPRMALDGSADGYAFYRRIAKEAGRYLKIDGMLFLEIGFDQGTIVSDLLEEQGFADVRIIRDLSGNDRVIVARHADHL